ncbi:MAG: NADH-quinone oxidoreductase subunit D [Candidatus Hydrogenedentota bacterium]|nr:MAG: NADH-quinone oxidoreductase subunit D [Candidatus Hydrogenedentota bacterium]
MNQAAVEKNTVRRHSGEPSEGRSGGAFPAERIEIVSEEGAGGRKTMYLQMGPQHPSTHGVLKLELELDGETIERVVPRVGYLHRCAEKLGERDRYVQAIPHTDRMDYVASMTQNLALCEAVEALLGLEIPLRARLLRVLLCELQRIASHMVWLGTHALDLGAMSPILYCFRDREEIQDLFEEACGARLTYSYIRIGGFYTPPSPRFFSWCREVLNRLPEKIDSYEALLTENPIFIRRLKGVGYISAEDAIAYGLSGPVLRGSGVARDIRVDEPYAAYDQIRPRVITRDEGDCYARFLVRMEEMRESVRLCREALEALEAAEPGPYLAENDLVVPPPKEDIYQDMAAMIRHWIIAIHGFKVPEGEVYRAVETPRGELGVFVSSDGSGRPFRLHYRSPCFVSLGALERMAKGGMLSDLVAIIGSIDVVLGEVDR